jgi:dimethylglycine dehydrogenase
MRWFSQHLADNGVRVKNVSDQYGGLALVGPRARQLLEKVARAKFPNETLPFMSVVQADVSLSRATVARLSVTGELGYEVYVPMVHLSALLDEVLNHARDFDARLIGMYALNSLRLEKSFGIWSREFSQDYTPRMCGLDRFIAYEKPDFIGRDAVLRDRDKLLEKRLVTLAIDASDADSAGYEPIWNGDQIVGYVTSGGYGHCVQMSLAMGYLYSSVDKSNNDLTVSILGERRRCKILSQPAFDPNGARMRG